jgi:hypothetical protein
MRYDPPRELCTSPWTENKKSNMQNVRCEENVGEFTKDCQVKKVVCMIDLAREVCPRKNPIIHKRIYHDQKAAFG